jgi:hypothetical protein
MVNSKEKLNPEGLEVQISDPREELLKRFDKLFVLVIGAMLIGFISMLFMVIGIVVDTWRFNSTIYKEVLEQNAVRDVMKKNSSEYEEIIKRLEVIDKGTTNQIQK